MWGPCGTVCFPLAAATLLVLFQLIHGSQFADSFESNLFCGHTSRLTLLCPLARPYLLARDPETPPKGPVCYRVLVQHTAARTQKAMLREQWLHMSHVRCTSVVSEALVISNQ